MLKWLQKYKIYYRSYFLQTNSFLYAELPIINHLQSIAFILTNTSINHFALALRTEMLGSH